MSLAVTSTSIAPAPLASYAGRHRSNFKIAGIHVEVQGDSPQAVDLGPQLLPFAIENFATENQAGEDIQVSVEWSAAIEASHGGHLFHSGCLWTVKKAGDQFQFDFTTGHLGPRPYKRLLVDEDFRYARVLLNRECLTAGDAGRALEYPLDELLITHHLSLGRGVELHGCGMVRGDGQSFLFVGHSGAGKSTTARLWTEHLPVEVLSDDRIIVRRRAVAAQGKGVGQEGPAHTFTMHGTPWHGEAAFASPGRAPLRRIFILGHGTANRIERLSPSAAVGELLARSFTPLYQPRFVDPVLALLEEMVGSMPCYRYQFVPDQTAVEKILAFHD